MSGESCLELFNLFLKEEERLLERPTFHCRLELQMGHLEGNLDIPIHLLHLSVVIEKLEIL